MKFPTIVLALSGIASAQFPFGGMGGGGDFGGGWGFAPSCAVCVSFAFAMRTLELIRNSAIMFFFRISHMECVECVVRTMHQHSSSSKLRLLGLSKRIIFHPLRLAIIFML